MGSEWEHLLELTQGKTQILSDCTEKLMRYRVRSGRSKKLHGLEALELEVQVDSEKYYEVITKEPYFYKGITFQPGDVFSQSKIIKLLETTRLENMEVKI